MRLSQVQSRYKLSLNVLILFEKILFIYKHWYKLSVLIRLSDNNVEKTEKV